MRAIATRPKKLFLESSGALKSRRDLFSGEATEFGILIVETDR